LSDKANPIWDEFILWLATPVERRGVVASEDEWARSKGYSDARQLRRWKKDPRFVARQAELGGAASNVTSPLSSPVEAMEADEADYLVVKAQLLENAKSGNLKATELFMKLYGRTWIEEEIASRATDFAGMDFDDLVAEALVSVSEETVVGKLRDRGWSVSRPDGSGESDASDSRF